MIAFQFPDLGRGLDAANPGYRLTRHYFWRPKWKLRLTNLDLTNYLHRWNLKNPNQIASSRSSNIFEVIRGSEQLILKIFTPDGAEDEKFSSDVLKIYNGKGAVRVIESDSDALLLEKLNGPNLTFLSKNKGEEQDSEIFANIVRKIHSVSIHDDMKVPHLEELFEALKTYEPPSSLDKRTFAKAVSVGTDLLQSQSKTVLLHGDLHHENVMLRENEYVCIDPKGFIGDPCYEIATILKNPWNLKEISENESVCLRRAKAFSELLILPLDRILKFAFVHMCLSTMWAIEDGDDPNHPYTIANFLEKHV